MALLEEQFTETLQAGAPDITYQGNEGQEQKIARELWDQLPPQAQQQFGSFEQFFSSGAWKQVLQMLQQQMQQEAPQQMSQQPQQPQQGLGSMMPAQMAYGGIAGADGRRAYGIGSWFQKKIMDPIKKNWKPIAAVGAGLALDRWGIPIGEKNIGQGWLGSILNKTRTVGVDQDQITEPRFSGLGGLLSNPDFLIPAASLVSGAFAKKDDPGYTGQGTGLNLQDIGKLANISDPQTGMAAGLRFLPDVETRKFTPEQMAATYAGSAQGGRIGAQEGGLMSLGGMEMDLRGGGFVPIGAKEKADDVPARLSKNEFVFTADAVRAAGDGNVDKGADKMYNTMKQLESRVG